MQPNSNQPFPGQDQNPDPTPAPLPDNGYVNPSFAPSQPTEPSQPNLRPQSPAPAPPVFQQPPAVPPPNAPVFSQQQPGSLAPLPTPTVPAFQPGVAGAYPMPKPKGKKKKLILGAVLGVFFISLIGGAVAAYTGIIGPNNPDNMWAAAMSNTGKGYDKLVDYSQQHKDDKGGELTGTYKVDTPSFKTDGSLEAKWYETTGSGKFDIGLGTTRAQLEARTVKSTGTYPDFYLKASGIKGLGTQLGEPETEELISKFNDQWVVVDHTLLENLQKQIGANQTTTPELTQEDAHQIAIKAGEALKEHVFTDDSAKAVFVVKQKIGKEKRDDRSMYHYKAGVDKQHLKDFATAMKAKLDETKLKDLYGSSGTEAYDQILKEIDGMDTGKAEADVWVDTKTKLFYAVRFTEEGKRDNYIEFGTPYTGGDEIPFVITMADKETADPFDVTIRLSLNTKTNQTKLEAKVTGDSLSAETKIDIKSGNTPVDVQKPEGAKQLSEVLGLPLETLFPTPQPTPAEPTASGIRSI